MLNRIGGGLVGFVLGFVSAVVAGLALGEVFNISQAEGAYAMGLFFFWGPAAGLLGAVLGAIRGLRRARP